MKDVIILLHSVQTSIYNRNVYVHVLIPNKLSLYDLVQQIL